MKLGVWRGVAGDALYLDDFRIAGPRHNGAMHLVCEWSVRERDIADAIAAATGTAKTAKQAECEASQSGPKGIAPKPPETPHGMH